MRLALGTALDVSEDMPDELPPDDPRAGHLGVYHWLTYVQDGLVAVADGPAVGALPGRAVAISALQLAP